MREVRLPPLFTAVAVDTPPFAAACAMASEGCDAGVVTHRLGNDAMQAAIVFAPEVPLRDALAVLMICGVGFQNALGALAPPEVGVHLDWGGTIRLNGGRCGQLRVGAADTPSGDVPDWIVVGLDLQIWPQSENTGETPDQTALLSEGCADVDVHDLLEAWVRHSLVWINRWTEEGAAPLHKEWTGLAHGISEPIEIGGRSGIFLGIDEHFGLLLRSGDETHIIPLTDVLET